MSRPIQRYQQWYRAALRLYPTAYREEYAEEMQTVFALRLAQSGENLLKLCLRELRDLPFSVVAAYLRERNRQKMKNNLERWFVQEPGSGKEILLAVLPFFLTAFVTGFLSLIPTVDQFPMWVGGLILLTLFLLQAVLGIAGLLARLPRWSMPYAGVPIALLPLVGIISLNAVGIITTPTGINAYLTTTMFLAISVVFMLLGLRLLLWLASKIKLTQPFVERVQVDKTLLSFMMYGGTLVFVALNYEDTTDGGVYLMLSALSMIGGAWMYLRQKNLPRQMAALAIGNSLAIFFSIPANLALIGATLRRSIHIRNFAIPSVVIFILITWVISQAMIFLPLLGRSPNSIKGNQESLAA